MASCIGSSNPAHLVDRDIAVQLFHSLTNLGFSFPGQIIIDIVESIQNRVSLQQILDRHGRQVVLFQTLSHPCQKLLVGLCSIRFLLLYFKKEPFASSIRSHRSRFDTQVDSRIALKDAKCASPCS